MEYFSLGSVSRMARCEGDKSAYFSHVIAPSAGSAVVDGDPMFLAHKHTTTSTVVWSLVGVFLCVVCHILAYFVLCVCDGRVPVAHFAPIILLACLASVYIHAVDYICT